jgi:hypothetical protein
MISMARAAKAALNKSLRMGAPWFGMGCKARTAAIARFATPQMYSVSFINRKGKK